MKIPYELIKKHYDERIGEICVASAYNQWSDPYSKDIDFESLMSPIERTTWQAIRLFGKMPLYPQYPIDSFWVDFANPYFNIVIECDGRAFHKDTNKDAIRDAHLRNNGWIVYRVSGATCFRVIDLEMEYFDDDSEAIYREKLKDLYRCSVDGLIRALAIKHCGLSVTNMNLS